MSTPDASWPPPGRPPVGSGASGRPDEVVAWFHCFAGIAGDMALGALLDAGADIAEVRRMVGQLGVAGWDLDAEEVLRGGIACTRALVRVREGGAPRTHRDIAALVSGATLPQRVVQRALAVFKALAVAEGALHRRHPDEVHFHEVGGLDALVDVVGTAAALEVLGIDTVGASSVATGTGMVGSSHGPLPNPSPAVLRLLAGAPLYGRETPVELTTPTGAALLAGLGAVFGPLPAMTVRSSGFGAGAAEMADLPNCTQVVTGERAPAGGPGDDPGQDVSLVSCTLDDVTGEQLGAALAALLDAGAHDAWIAPVVMKKGRPGHVLHALADPSQVGRIRAVMTAATGTFGVRSVAGQRWPAARTLRRVTVEGEQVRMKVGAGRAKPEFDDVARVAAATGLAPREVASRAEEAWRRGEGG